VTAAIGATKEAFFVRRRLDASLLMEEEV